MFKQTRDIDGRQRGFVHQAVNAGIRLDCRRPSEYRQVSFSLSRSEAYSQAFVTVGSTKVVCVVRGELAKPYPDRPTEGTLQFSAKSSVRAETYGLVSSADITRALERTIRESECLDMESLCVVAGSAVWAICCDVVLVDHDGNAIDAAILAALAALRAFRRPEVSAVTGVGLAGENTWRSGTSVKVHSAEERDPLPLALHQTPLAVTISLFKDPLSEKDPVLVADPTAAEEAAQSGSITYTFNAHRELCGMYKSGEGCGLRVSSVVSGSVVAATCTAQIHSALDAALHSLDLSCEEERSERLRLLQARRFGGAPLAPWVAGSGEAGQTAARGAGIDRNDPILSYGLIHGEIFTRE